MRRNRQLTSVYFRTPLTPYCNISRARRSKASANALIIPKREQVFMANIDVENLKPITDPTIFYITPG